MTLLEVQSVAKSYGPVQAVPEVSLSLNVGEVLAILGPSGCGKTTLLRLIAGLETPDAGEVLFEGRSQAGVPAEERGFGLMFQDLALFPHLDVFENVAFGLRMRRWEDGAVTERVQELLAMTRISSLARRRVQALSGGERQRVALARSLAPRPRLLMLDEPLGALDRTLREGLVEEVRQVLREAGVAALYVTHDQEEAFAIAQRVCIMNMGQIVQEGLPEEVYIHPASAFVARFLGHRNLISAIATLYPEGMTVEGVFGRWLLPEEGLEVRGPCTLLVPPTALVLTQAREGPVLTGSVEDAVFRAGFYRVRFRAHDMELTADIPANHAAPGSLASGTPITLTVDFRAVRLLPWALEDPRAY